MLSAISQLVQQCKPSIALAALYLATGQDVANIVESNQCTTYQHATSKGDFIFNHVAGTDYGDLRRWHGATLRECLRMMGCEGKGKALKLYEIAAALVVAGELSLSGQQRSTKTTPTSGLMRMNAWRNR